MMSAERLRTSPRPHRVVTQTAGVVFPTHRTLGRRGGIQTARQKQEIESNEFKEGNVRETRKGKR